MKGRRDAREVERQRQQRRRHGGRHPVLPQRLLALAVMVALLASGALLPTIGARSDAAPEERPLVRTVDLMVPSSDGTSLSVRVHYPSYLDDAAAARPRPVVLGTHGWGDNKDQLDDDGARLAAQGLILVAYDSRGYGNSGGTVGLNGPDEVADVSALIDWIATWDTDAAAPAVPRDVPPVLMDDREGTDPRLGMIGISYAGAIQMLAALEDDRIDALVPEITWSHLGTSLNPNDVVKQRWLDLLFFGGTAAAHADNDAGPDDEGLDDELASWYLATHSTGRLPSAAGETLDERSPLHRLGEIDADVLLIQGWRDTLFPASQAVDAWHAWGAPGVADAAPPSLRSTEGAEGGPSAADAGSDDGLEEDRRLRLLIHGGGHGAGLQGRPRDLVDARQDAFLIAALTSAGPAERDLAFHKIPPVTFLRDGPFEASAWPPAGTQWRTAGTTRATTADGIEHDPGTAVVLRQTGAATSHTETPNFEDRHGTGAADTPSPTTAWFTLDLPGATELAGRPHLHIEADATVADAPLYVSLAVSDGDAGPAALGAATVVDAQVVPFRIPAEGCDPCLVPLNDLNLALPLGAHLHVRIATADSAFANAREPATITIPIDGVALEVPVFDAAAASWSPSAPPLGPVDAGARSTPGPQVLPLMGLLMVVLAWVSKRSRMR